MVRQVIKVAPMVFACLSCACAIPEADWPGTQGISEKSVGESAMSLLPSRQAVGEPLGDLFQQPVDVSQADASELTLRRSRLISYDFVQTMVQLDALHPHRVRLALPPSDSRFDQILLYSLTLAGYDAGTGTSSGGGNGNDEGTDTGLKVDVGTHSPMHTDTDGALRVDVMSDLPQVIDPLFSQTGRLPDQYSPSSAPGYAIGARMHGGAGTPGVPASRQVTIATRTVAEPPLLPNGESEAGIYSFFVLATSPSLPDIRMVRIYRVSGGSVMPVSMMWVEGAEASDLRVDDAVF